MYGASNMFKESSRHTEFIFFECVQSYQWTNQNGVTFDAFDDVIKKKNKPFWKISFCQAYI